MHLHHLVPFLPNHACYVGAQNVAMWLCLSKLRMLQFVSIMLWFSAHMVANFPMFTKNFACNHDYCLHLKRLSAADDTM